MELTGLATGVSWQISQVLPVSMPPAVGLQMHTAMSGFLFWGSILRPSCVYSKHLPHRAISSAPRESCMHGLLLLWGHIPTTNEMLSLELHTDLN